MALSCARPVGGSGAALSASFAEGCRQIGHPRPVAAKLTPPVNHTSQTTLVATRSKCCHNCGSSSAPHLARRRWPCRNGTWAKGKGSASASASASASMTFSTASGTDGRGEEEESPPLRVGIIGFGNFGQFIAKGIVRQGHEVVATSRTDYTSYCEENGIQFHRCMDAMCSGEKPLDVLLVCSSILSTESLVRRIPFYLLSPDTVVADVLSVKQFPKNLFLEVLPPEMGILCTHPMFGPESGKNGWGSLPFVYDKVRVDANRESRQARNCERFLQVFRDEGCRMVEMSCEEHDRHAAGSQFITHTIGRILSHLDLESTPINTKGYETLLQLTENTVSDSFDLYYGLFMYNVNATEQMDNLDRAFETVKQKLFSRLHDILRKQLVERVPMNSTTTVAPKIPLRSPFFLPSNNDMTDLSSFAISPTVPPATSSVTSMAATKNK